MYLKTLTLVLLGIFAQSTFAQQVGDFLQITLIDQSIIQGKLFEKRPDYWVIETKSMGQIELKKVDIIGFTTLNSSHQVVPVPHRKSTLPNYWSAPSAIPLEAGEGHYQTSDLMVHTVQYGFTKHISASVGFEIITSLEDFFSNNAQKRIRFPAFSVASIRYAHSLHPNFHVAGGFLIGRDQVGLFSGLLSDRLSVLYGTATWGNRDYNMSFTYGHRLEKIPLFTPFPTTSELKQTMNFISWSGKINVGSRFSWVGESWAWTDAFSTERSGMINLGFRYLFRRFNVGAGVLLPFSEGDFGEPFPLLNLGVPFRLL
jgi:hypothetical protein